MSTYPLVALGEVADLGSGGTPRRGIAEYYGPGIPWLSIADLNDGIVTSSKESLTEAGIKNSSAKIVPPGTILVAMYGSIGKLGIAGIELSTSQAIAFIKADPTLIDNRFLFHYLLTQRPKLQSRGRGGTQMNIGQSDLRLWPVPLPPLAEQRRIAAILDKASAIRQKRQQTLDHLDSLSQSIFHEMFESQTWPETPLGELLDFLTSGSRGWAKYYSDQGSNFIRINNVKGGYLHIEDMAHVNAPDSAEAKRTRVLPGDILLSITADLGRTAVIPQDLGEAYINQHLAILRVPALNSRYLADFLESPTGKRRLLGRDRGATKAGLNFDDIRSIRVPIPTKNMQEEYSSYTAKIQFQKARISSAVVAESEFFASLQSRAFRGEL